jgi:hypothetical protein
MWHVWGRGEVHTEFWWEDVRELNYVEDLRVERWIILKMDLQEVGWGGVDWIDLAQGKDRRRAIVKAVINLRVPKKRGEFLD